MTREEVKNAGSKHAQDMYCSGDNPTPRYRIAQIHASKDGFVAGAEWRINSVWHEITELPKPDKRIFLLQEDGTIKQIYTYDGVNKLFNTLLGYKWAYAEDLTPIKED